jgi:hypothetical protein
MALDKALERIFEEATEEVLENTSCPTIGDISNGWCDLWAVAAKKRLPGSEIRQMLGHYFIFYEGVAYDSDTYPTGGFEPPE